MLPGARSPHPTSDREGRRRSIFHAMENMAPLVLVIDDEPALRDVLEMRVESWGFRVCTAEDADQAVQVARARRPDIVLTDVVLPGGSGVDVLKALRELEPTVPVI